MSSMPMPKPDGEEHMQQTLNGRVTDHDDTGSVMACQPSLGADRPPRITIGGAAVAPLRESAFHGYNHEPAASQRFRSDSHDIVSDAAEADSSSCSRLQSYLEFAAGVPPFESDHAPGRTASPTARDPNQVSVSVVVPTRNERGNIATAVERTPDMGEQTEMVFVDGNSTDGTVEEIEPLKREQPQRDINCFTRAGPAARAMRSEKASPLPRATSS